MAKQNKWKKGINEQTYSLDMFGTDEIALHHFHVIKYNKPQIVPKLTEKQRKELGYTQIKGPLEDITISTHLEIHKTDWDLFYVGAANFNKGKFVYGIMNTSYSPCGGLGDGKDLRTIQEFKETIADYFGLQSFKPIQQVFLNTPGLPECHKKAIAELLK